MSAQQWMLTDIPDLTGKRALVTGVTSGIGEHTVLELARRGAQVVMAARNEQKLDASIQDIRRALPYALLVPLIMDLADLSSVRRAAAAASTHGALNILVNNAGVMATPHHRTADGFELQFGTNHLGHFALTGLLLPILVASGEARVVTVSSHAHRSVRSVPLTDPRTGSGHYQKWVAYGRSKLANLMFSFELDRRARASGLPITSVAAHPGYSATNLMSTGLNMGHRRAEGTIVVAASRLLAQPSTMGAMPSLMAATMPGLPGGSFTGPRGFAELRGLPTLIGASKSARDEKMAAALWKVSEEATGVVYP